MSGAVPHFSPEWLEEYRRKLRQTPATATGEGRDNPPRTPAPARTHQPRQDAPSCARTEAGDRLSAYSAEAVAVPLRAAEGHQTDTERRYNRDVLHGAGRFEAVTLRLPGGGRYTPDFMTVDDGVVTFHEVKGSYRLGSQGRAFTAFHDAAAYYPMWRFVWAKWTGKAWERKTLPEIRI